MVFMWMFCLDSFGNEFIDLHTMQGLRGLYIIFHSPFPAFPVVIIYKWVNTSDFRDNST